MNLDQLCVNTIRTLAIDAVQQVNSGHPGTPMAMAPVAYTLWQRVLRFDPDYERLGELSVTLDGIKRFRQLDRKCPGPLDLGHRDHHGPWARVWPPAWAWVRRSAKGDKHERDLGEDLTPR